MGSFRGGFSYDYKCNLVHVICNCNTNDYGCSISLVDQSMKYTYFKQNLVGYVGVLSSIKKHLLCRFGFIQTRVEKIMIFIYFLIKKIGFFLFKSDLFDFLNLFDFF